VSRGRIDPLLYPCLDLGVVVEPREDPAEQAQTRLLAPTVGIAAAREEPCCLPRSADQGEDHITDRECEEKSFHEVRVAPALRAETDPMAASDCRLRREPTATGPSDQLSTGESGHDGECPSTWNVVGGSGWWF